MNIYNYSDYRHFLKDSFGALQKANVNLSMREILRRIGSSSPSYYKEVVIDGKKNMSDAMARKIARFLQLNDNEAEYFLSLVAYNQAKTEIERNIYYSKLIKHKNTTRASSENRILTPQEYEYLSSWEIPAIREFLHFYKNFKNRSDSERKELAGFFLPKLSSEQIDNAIGALESLGFIKKDSKGNYRKTNQNIRSVSKTPAAYFTLCQNMKHALDIINKAPSDTRIFKNVILSTSPQTYSIIEKKIQDFCRDILDIVSNDTTTEDHLYTLGLQLFPLTHKVPEDKTK